ncbi:MAG TPA: HEAT repeat domain-containing protein [Verrucomicrobiae bacterium]
MKAIWKFMLLGSFVLAFCLPAPAKEVTEDQCIADLASSKEKVVIAALQGIEKNYPTSQNAIAKIKPLLTDDRLAVKRKTARVLGIVGAEVSDADLKNIASLLDSADKATIIDGLKSLRGLKAESTVPKITPLLKNPDANVKRDACRTLAVLADKSVIPSIEPLLQDKDKGVVKDASDAITALKAK